MQMQEFKDSPSHSQIRKYLDMHHHVLNLSRIINSSLTLFLHVVTIHVFIFFKCKGTNACAECSRSKNREKQT